MTRKLLAIAFLFAFGHLSAQKFQGGFFAGMTTSQINGDGLGGYDLAGVQAGFFTFLELSDKSDLQLELSFIQKGSRQPPSDSSNFYKSRLNYIVIPILYRLHVGKVAFEAGPSLDINVYAQEEDLFGEFESDPSYSNYSASFIVSVNYNFSDNFWISFRTNNSIMRIREGETTIPFPEPNSPLGDRNIVLSFGLHYAFM